MIKEEETETSLRKRDTNNNVQIMEVRQKKNGIIKRGGSGEKERDAVIQGTLGRQNQITNQIELRECVIKRVNHGEGKRTKRIVSKDERGEKER